MILYAIVLGLIVVTLLEVSRARLGRVKTKVDYLVAGRSLPTFVLVFTLLSSWIGSGSLTLIASLPVLIHLAGGKGAMDRRAIDRSTRKAICFGVRARISGI